MDEESSTPLGVKMLADHLVKVKLQYEGTAVVHSPSCIERINELLQYIKTIEKEKKELRGGADGHVLAISEYEPGSEYTYYWGSAWDKAAIKTVDAWNAYMAEYAQKVRTPLTVTY